MRLTLLKTQFYLSAERCILSVLTTFFLSQTIRIALTRESKRNFLVCKPTNPSSQWNHAFHRWLFDYCEKKMPVSSSAGSEFSAISHLISFKLISVSGQYSIGRNECCYASRHPRLVDEMLTFISRCNGRNSVSGSVGRTSLPFILAARISSRTSVTRRCDPHVQYTHFKSASCSACCL